MNAELAHLNFRRLLHYSEIPVPAPKYDPPRVCTGFCTSCEQKGDLLPGDHVLYRMSHACTTADYEKVLGPLSPSPECTNPPITSPIMFILESPGPEDSNGEDVTYDQFTKHPPTRTYYWLPEPERTTWFERDYKRNYGQLFASLMSRFNLRNVYITNAIKCGKSPANNLKGFEPFGHTSGDKRIFENCYSEFLSQEIGILNPKAIFAFGDAANGLLKRKVQVPLFCLWHPATRQSCVNMTDKNISAMETALKQTGLLEMY